MLKIKSNSGEPTQNPARRTETPQGDAQGTRQVNCTHKNKNGSQGQLKPFHAVSPERNYRAMYRAACNFHERNNPPENTDAYWAKAAADMAAVSSEFQGDAFLRGLLLAIWDELGREAGQRADDATSGNGLS